MRQRADLRQSQRLRGCGNGLEDRQRSPDDGASLRNC
jgi:hypothetical protein